MIKRYPIKYIDGKPSRGILIDWKAVRREYKRLKIPKQYYYPLRPDFSKISYVVSMSQRARGKTTQLLILGLVLYAMYGIIPHYIRQFSRQCEPMNIRDLFDVVLVNGYIERIFEQWNHIFYRGKRWYLCRIDEDGNMVERDSISCCVCFGLDEADSLKSVYNCPTGDMIFFDEFISTRMGYDDFKNFCDLVSTIGRLRYGVVVFLSANTINRNSRWFDEYAIADTVRKMELGDTEVVVSPLGSHFWIELLEADNSEDRAFINRRLFGFRNTKLDAITGRGSWTEETYQHIPPDKEDEGYHVAMLNNRIFIEMKGQYMKLAIVKNPDIGVCVYVTPATRIYEDSIIFTADDVLDSRYVFCFGRGLPVNKIWTLYTSGRFYYAHNAAGCFVQAYVSYAQSRQRTMVR